MMSRTMLKDAVNLVGQTVIVKGWVNARRDMGKVTFIDLRDRSGIAQIVLAPSDLSEAAQAAAKELRSEYCISIEGTVQARGPKQINPNLPTGTIEIVAKDVQILNAAKTPPFEIEDTSNVNEEARLTYRYLDLRSSRMLKNLELRDRVITFFRDYLHKEGFMEIETPILTKGTPEGSREYLVPSRLHPGDFYVLPQSPQQFKQLCMVAGLERYFQIARCFRDEDQRGDRQPEFTQLDLEMSFVTQEDVLRLNEKMFIEMVKAVAPEKHISQTPFPRITYKESMEKYGNDKPDLRKDKNDPNELAFCWVVDFPMFEDDGEGGIQAAHHPFCTPNPEDIHLLETDPMKVRAWSYDLVLNGYELSSGSIRIHTRDLQNKIFELLGLDPELIKARFGHMLEAFEYGAPPHGGMAPGIDRVVMILANEPNIREVIPFPKTGDAKDLLMGAPSAIEEKRLKEAHVQVVKDKS
jgi:aspartyl-tRNA synthetase